jgi:hypothetical protein
MGFGELVLIVTILAILAYALAVPIVGIVKAVRRKERGARSSGAVLWSAINLGIFGLLAAVGIVVGMPPLGPGIGLALNGVWLYLAIKANRQAAGRSGA